MKGYPRWFTSSLVAGSSLLYATGCLLAPTTLEMRAAWAPAWRLASGTRLGMAAAHAVLGLLLVFALGALWSLHMRAGWRKRRQRSSGLLLALGFLWLALTAVGVYYLGDELLADIAGLSHLVVGLLLLLPFAWHALRGGPPPPGPARRAALTARPHRRVPGRITPACVRSARSCNRPGR